MNEQILSPRAVLVKSRIEWMNRALNALVNLNSCKHEIDDYDDDYESEELFTFEERGNCAYCVLRTRLCVMRNPTSWRSYDRTEKDWIQALDDFIMGMVVFREFVKMEPSGCLGKIEDFAIKTRDMYNESGDTINDVNNGITDDVTV